MNDSIQGIYWQTSSTDTEYWTNGVWHLPLDYQAWQVNAGPTAAEAALYQWRQKNGHGVTAADQALNNWLIATGSQAMGSLLCRINPDGSYNAGGMPETEMVLPDVGAAYLGLRSVVSGSASAQWLNGMLRMATYLIVADNLPNSALTGWKATCGWYTNGNYEVADSLICYQMWIATGDPRFKDLFETQWAATLSPDQTTFPGCGLVYNATPSLPDGSDGSGYLTEAGGYDGDYVHLQSGFEGRLYVLSHDPRVLRLLNLTTNQLWSYVDPSTWILDASNGSRHDIPNYPFTTEALPVLAWLGGRSDLGPYVASQFGEIYNQYSDNAINNRGNYYYYRGYGSAVAVMLLADLDSRTAPAAPANPAVVVSNSSATLSWNDSIGARTYNIKRATTHGGPYTTIASQPPSTFTDGALTNGTTYYYVISGINSAGESTNSTELAATPQPVAPRAPISAVAIASGSSQAAIGWIQATGATGYNIKRALTPGGPYANVASNVAPGAGMTPYLDKTVTNGQTYYYVVTGTNAYGESPNSPEAAVTTQTLPAPVNVMATSGSSQVSVFWGPITAQTTPITYNIERATTSGGPYTTILTATAGNTITDTTVTNGTPYYYVVSALCKGAESLNSPEACTIPSPLPVPSLPITTPGNGQVVITWGKSAGAASYNVKRSTSASGPFSLISSGTSLTTYTDRTVTNGTTYYYLVTALTGSGLESPNSAIVSATPYLSTAPAAPTHLAATAGASQLSLSWWASTNAISYNVKRSSFSNGPYTAIATGMSSLAYTDSDVAPGMTYYYVVTATGTGGESVISSQVSAAIAPAAPTNPQAVVTGTSAVILRWDSSLGATTYTVQRSTLLNGTYTDIATGLTALSATDSDLSAGVTYYYQVTTTGNSGTSPATTPFSVTMPPAAPSNIAANPGAGSICLTWPAPTGATSYNVLRSTQSSGPYTAVANGQASTSYVDSGLVPGTTYYYVISAANAGGTGPLSSQVSATPCDHVSISIDHSAPGTVTVTVTGASGIPCDIQASTDLASWTTLSSTTSLLSSFSWADSDAVSFPKRYYRAVWGPQASLGQAVTDNFSGHLTGSALNGAITQSGSKTWQAGGDVKIGNINGNNYAAITGTVNKSGGFLISAPTATVTLSANVKPSGVSNNWISIGLQSAVNKTPLDGGAGQIWVLLRSSGAYSIFAKGTTYALGNGTVPSFSADGFNAVWIQYAPSTHLVNVKINGTSVLTNYDLDDIGFLPAINSVVFFMNGSLDTTKTNPGVDDVSLQ